MAATRRTTVGSFADLLSHPLSQGINALCWPRNPDGDFREVAQLLAPSEGVVVVEADVLVGLSLSPPGRAAAASILEDMQRLRELGHEPVLNCIAGYPGDERGFPIAIDVMSFHADRAPIEVDTWLCTYWGKGTEGLDNDDARRLIDVPTIREVLLREHGGQDDDDFVKFLEEGSFDLHYGAVDDAHPFAFGVGNLWRIAVAWPKCPVPPCIHRAPRTLPGDEPRLLLIC